MTQRALPANVNSIYDANNGNDKPTEHCDDSVNVNGVAKTKHKNSFFKKSNPLKLFSNNKNSLKRYSKAEINIKESNGDLEKVKFNQLYNKKRNSFEIESANNINHNNARSSCSSDKDITLYRINNKKTKDSKRSKSSNDICSYSENDEKLCLKKSKSYESFLISHKAMMGNSSAVRANKGYEEFIELFKRTDERLVIKDNTVDNGIPVTSDTINSIDTSSVVTLRTRKSEAFDETDSRCAYESLYEAFEEKNSIEDDVVEYVAESDDDDKTNASLITDSSNSNSLEQYRMSRYEACIKERQEQIYLCSIQVSLHPTSLEPVIMWLNPLKNHSLDDLDSYRYFCFPESKDFFANYNYKNIDQNTYQFVRTKLDGSKEFGYCRKYVHPKAKKELPVVFCIASYVDSFNLYDKILEELGNVYYTQELEHVHFFLTCLYTKPLYSPGDDVPYMKLSDNRNLMLKIDKDDYLHSSNCDILLRYLSVENIIKVINTLLMEKSVVLFGHKLSALSRSIKAFRTLLYPFGWPYSLVPVLPSNLISYVDSPSPFIFGLMSDNFSHELIHSTPDVLFACLTKNKVYNYNQSECDLLPDTLVMSLIKLYKNDNIFKPKKQLQISDAFMHIFVEIFFNYRKFITKDKKFRLKDFINYQKSNSYKKFLIKFKKTIIFKEFIHNYIENESQEQSLFDKRLNEYYQTLDNNRLKKPYAHMSKKKNKSEKE